MPASMVRSLLTAPVFAAVPVVVGAGPPQAARVVVKAAAAPMAPVSLRKFRRLASLTSGRFLVMLFMRASPFQKVYRM